jgi:ABC-type branched-subunit amino acid transport system substrate-binding protein
MQRYSYRPSQPVLFKRSLSLERKDYRRSWGLIAAILILSASAISIPNQSTSAEDDPHIERLFAQAMRDYRRNDYSSAVEGFQQILNRPLNQRYSSALLMLGKSHYQLHAYSDAVRSAQRLLREFPYSAFADDGHHLLGNCYLRQGLYLQSAEEYVAILESDGDDRLKGLARTELKTLLAQHLNSEDRRRLAQGHPDIPLLQEASVRVLDRFRVGIISSLTGNLSDVGNEMVQGIRLAVRQSTLPNVDLIVEDSKGEPLRAVQAAQQFVEDESVVAIIGPVRSEATVGAAAVANCEEIVLITPTATETGLSNIGPYIFQLNVTPQTQGAAIAEYAIDQLGLRRFAVLAVSDSYGKDLARAFVSEVEYLGGSILSHEWYFEGATDFGQQLTKIREAGLALEQADSSVWEWKIFELKTSGLIDTTTEELFPPVDSIDGLFLAAYAEDIALITPQIAFQKINTQLLGANSWNSEEVVHAGGPYVEGAVFAADFFEGNSSEPFLDFTDAYRRQYGETPTKVAALGFDAMNILLTIFEKGVTFRSDIRDRLANTRHFQGVSGIISFPGGQRANTHVLFLTIRNGKIVELK